LLSLKTAVGSAGAQVSFFFPRPTTMAPSSRRTVKRLAFTSGRSGYNEIWTCDATDCSEPQQLTSLKVVSGMPRWSPDSKQIVFDSRPTGHSQVMMISAEGGSPVPLTDGKSEDKVPSWSSDGKFVLFFQSQRCLTDLEGSGQRRAAFAGYATWRFCGVRIVTRQISLLHQR
jgi:Tol biopolymer transport system component